MRILVIRPCNAIGGAEIYNLNLIKGFRKYYPEIELFFITTFPEFARRIKSEGGQAITLPVFSEEVGTKKGLLRLTWNLPKYLFYYLKTILSLNKKKKIDLIWLHSATEKIVLTPLLRILGFKIIWVEHGPFFSFPSAKEVFNLYKISSYFANKIITVSMNTLFDALGGGISRRKLICVYTSIDSNYFSSIMGKILGDVKKNTGIRTRKKIIGYIGDVSRGKGFMDFLGVAERLCRIKKNISFLIVGKGMLLNYSKKLARKKTLRERFFFVGFQKDVKQYLRFFDLVFYPNPIGSLSMVLMEAMAMGVPVVARDIGGNRELVVHGKTGYLFKNESLEELAEIIINLLKDEKKRKAMGKAARERIVKHFNQKKWVAELHSVFEEIVRK